MFRKNKYLLLIIFIGLFSLQRLSAQVELAPEENSVYQYLEQMKLKQIISDFNSTNLPISRNEVATYLKEIDLKKEKLTGTEQSIMKKLMIDYEKELTNSEVLVNTISFSHNGNFRYLFDNSKAKHFYIYKDKNTSLFFDLHFCAQSFISKGDSIGKNNIGLSYAGFTVRGSLYNSVGYYFDFNVGRKVFGTPGSSDMLLNFVPTFKGNTTFLNDGSNYQAFTGYLRYENRNKIFALEAGRFQNSIGRGYIDKLFLSNNSVPFDLLKLDLKYKKISYSFFYGSLRGDSLGVPIDDKNISGHRLDINFSKSFKIGLYESIIISNNPFSFVFFNPIAFLTSADLNTGGKETTKNNTILGIDIECQPLKNIAIQGSLLIDDINFSTLFKNDYTSNDNKFGFQSGLMWTDAFTMNNLLLTVEYTRLDPFVYSHRKISNSYSHYRMSLGHHLPPNSDEWAIKISYPLSSRAFFSVGYSFVRHGEGVVLDSTGKLVVNYGGDINRGDGDYYTQKNVFLQGNRINLSEIHFEALFEPIKQYFFRSSLYYRTYNIIYKSIKYTDPLFLNIQFVIVL
ncbi:MAG: capsule assembly Wzi family protein [Ignavibacteria bacterium]